MAIQHSDFQKTLRDYQHGFETWLNNIINKSKFQPHTIHHVIGSVPTANKQQHITCFTWIWQLKVLQQGNCNHISQAKFNQTINMLLKRIMQHTNETRAHAFWAGFQGFKTTTNNVQQHQTNHYPLNSKTMASKHSIGTSMFMQYHHHEASISNKTNINNGNFWAG